MTRSRPPRPPERRQRWVDLARAGWTPEELSRECETTAQSIATGFSRAGGRTARAMNAQIARVDG